MFQVIKVIIRSPTSAYPLHFQTQTEYSTLGTPESYFTLTISTFRYMNSEGTLFLINCLWGKKHCIHLLKAEKRQSVGSMAGSRPRDVMENIRTGADREGDQKA